MRKSIGTLLVALIAFGLIDLAPAKDIMNDHLLSLVRSYNQLENKLERHEYRERALGEIIKKGLQSLQMGQRSMEPMKGIFSRLDERVSQIETLLMSQEQKYSLQTEKIEEIIKLIKWTNENNNRNSIMPSIPVVVEAPENLEMLKEVRSLSANVAKLIDMSAKLIEKTEKMSKKAPETEDLLSKMQSTLVKLYTPPVTTTAAPIIIDNSEFENKVMTSFESIAANIKDLKTNAPPPPVQCASGLIEADKEFIQALTNETLTALQSLKVDALGASEKALSTITSQIDDSKGKMEDKLSQLRTDLNATIALLGKFQADVNSSYSSLNDGLASFNKIVMSNSDEIINTQRKIEFATHQISQKVSDLIVFQNLELSQALMKRFDDVDESIANNHIEALQNITSTMESEISNVWRQIEIMHSEITESKNELNKLNGETETYVNGTFSTMDGMEAKVSKITSRMLDVDSNLNYLLGRLSLITQEFNQIKTGLGDALEQIRGSFKEVRDKVNKGSGPHEIPKSQYDLDNNLVSK